MGVRRFCCGQPCVTKLLGAGLHDVGERDTLRIAHKTWVPVVDSPVVPRWQTPGVRALVCFFAILPSFYPQHLPQSTHDAQQPRSVCDVFFVAVANTNVQQPSEQNCLPSPRTSLSCLRHLQPTRRQAPPRWVPPALQEHREQGQVFPLSWPRPRQPLLPPTTFSLHPPRAIEVGTEGISTLTGRGSRAGPNPGTHALLEGLADCLVLSAGRR